MTNCDHDYDFLYDFTAENGKLVSVSRCKYCGHDLIEE
jgi:hypothetical protein